jgi:hypothetical protein
MNDTWPSGAQHLVLKLILTIMLNAIMQSVIMLSVMVP